DLAVGTQGNSTVSIFLGNATGGFQPQTTFSEPGTLQAIAVGDFNGDGKLDIAVANVGTGASANTVSILLGAGNGTFQLQNNNYATGATPAALVTGDFNRDGKLDLATANSAGGSVSILLGNGDGTFPTHSEITTDVGSVGLAVGELNGDAKT